MIYCVWYPSGGFGHFVNSVLNSYGQNFVRPKHKIKFSSNGNSHSVDYVAPAYHNDQDFYNFDFDTNLNYSVIIDNGINNEGTKFINFFPNARIIKLCYNDVSWPIVAYTMIAKALKSNLDTELPIDASWERASDWAKREKYFLFLRDHNLRFAWKPNNLSTAIEINELLDYHAMQNAFRRLDINVDSFDDVWERWFSANKIYIDPVIKANEMINGNWHHLTEIWDQAVFYYFIWCNYNIEVPHNDFENFFTSQQQYQTWLEKVL